MTGLWTDFWKTFFGRTAHESQEIDASRKDVRILRQTVRMAQEVVESLGFRAVL
jgi:hypothetical protein